MKFRHIALLVLFCIQPLLSWSQGETIKLDYGWKFFRGGAQGAERPGFDDSSWRSIDIPHDWSIEDIPGTDSPFSPAAVSQVSGGFTAGGTGWYRREFDIPAAKKDSRIIIQFDGVYMNSEVWINGTPAGTNPYGYTSFWFDITDKIKAGEKNVLAVKVKNEGENSRWYSGSGIYRHVWLRILEPIHFAQWGVSVITSSVSSESATAIVTSEVLNHSGSASSIKMSFKIFGPSGRLAGSAEDIRTAGESAVSRAEIKISNPELWSPESPSLYLLVCEVSENGKVRDKYETKFGIRSISFDNVTGFSINGKAMKLKGGCFHHDHGPLGAKSYDRAEERRVELLKASGFNAIRCSHNPPSPAFLDACDRLGMLVIDEAFDMWQYGKNPHDYSLFFGKWWKKDIESMVKRDRNHPSVIMWSIGNEISGMDNPEVVETAGQMKAFVNSLDPTRPVIAAVNNLNQKKDPFFAALDIAGYNYGSGGDHLRENIFKADHARVPERIMIQTESYPLEAFQSWMDVVDHPWLLGDFVWTAFDYIGEASIGWRGYWQKSDFYPWTLAYCGDIDICGWKRPQSFYRDALWMKDKLSVFVKPPVPSFPENPERMSWSKWHWYDASDNWNWKGYEGRALEVSAYSSCEVIELFLNGKSLGRKKTDRSTRFMAIWDVPYQPGELKAIGYSGGKRVAESVLRTAGEPVSLRITPDRNAIRCDGQDLSYVTIELIDKDGIRNTMAENLLKFEIKGPGTIAGTGNANPVSTESYQKHQRKAWQGRCLVIVKAGTDPGKIVLRVSAEGIPSAEITISTSPR